MNRAHIPGFPNRLPCIDWQTYFPKFKDTEGEDDALHLVWFHMHVPKLGVELHEGFLMKTFMETFEGKAGSWYEKLPAPSLYSLKDFHIVFFENYKGSYPSLLLVQNCCDHFENFIQNLEKFYGDEEFMDEEILEALYENPFHHQQEMVSSLLDENETKQDFNDDSHIHIHEFVESLQHSC
jgi:hypothetical protein